MTTRTLDCGCHYGAVVTFCPSHQVDSTPKRKATPAEIDAASVRIQRENWRREEVEPLLKTLAVVSLALGHAAHWKPTMPEYLRSVIADEARDAKEREAPVRSLLCSCCGGRTRGRQWHNRDTGYGLCDDCADNPRLMRGETPESFARLYGRRGIHYKVQA